MKLVHNETRKIIFINYDYVVVSKYHKINDNILCIKNTGINCPLCDYNILPLRYMYAVAVYDMELGETIIIEQISERGITQIYREIKKHKDNLDDIVFELTRDSNNYYILTTNKKVTNKYSQSKRQTISTFN